MINSGAGPYGGSEAASFLPRGRCYSSAVDKINVSSVGEVIRIDLGETKL
jgi:hypothetical protein